ncbi:MAG: hypothetical protein JWO13_2935 [Acidobacteriales bacterium]|nr:hypothetical protein [Terriglobales bacterium]
MNTLLRFMLLLCLIAWLGGIIFFSLIAAPATFKTMELIKDSQPFAGLLISRMLFPLHALGQLCAVIFLIASAALYRSIRRIPQFLIVIMFALTLFSQYWVTPRIEDLRFVVAEKNVDMAKRAEFDKLHRTSVGLEGAVLLLGLGVVWLVAKKPQR